MSLDTEDFEKWTQETTFRPPNVLRFFSELGDSCEYGSRKFFALCGLGGILSCGTTHTALVPLDLVKCRIQVDPAKYGNVINGFKVTLKEAGIRELGKGWAPTLMGYSAQGLGKFGFYELFKLVYSDALGEVRFLTHLLFTGAF